MCSAQVSPSDRSAGLSALPAWWLVEAAAEAGFVLRVRFADGAAGVVEMANLIGSDEAGVFAALRDPEVFGRVHVEHGAATWPGEVDLAPDAMHAAIAASGRWVL